MVTPTAARWAVNFPVNGVPNGYGQSMGRIRDPGPQWDPVNLAPGQP
ncbi:hypothetical protein ACE0DR_28895 [Azotobacter sp. CWF10]